LLASIYAFRHRNKHRTAVTLAGWCDQFSDLWSVKKHARVADLQYLADQIQARMDELIEDAERATETLRSVDPTAGPVRVPLRDWRGLTRDKAKLLDQIMTERVPLYVGLCELPCKRSAGSSAVALVRDG
jgi:hypothetical protein